MTPQEILENFTGNKCLCGEFKGYKMSHCRRCYFRLPTEKRKALYKPFLGGYIEAFIDSSQFLGLLPAETEAK
jgi:hypothetical protein